MKSLFIQKPTFGIIFLSICLGLGSLVILTDVNVAIIEPLLGVFMGLAALFLPLGK